MFGFLSVRELLELKVSVSGAIFTHLLIPKIPAIWARAQGAASPSAQLLLIVPPTSSWLPLLEERGVLQG